MEKKMLANYNLLRILAIFLVILLWSSFFVTLVAKKYRLATMLPFVPRMVCDSR